MPKSIPLFPSKVYHIYSHANGEENLFRQDENYHYFLNKYSDYIHPLAETFAYCLLPNHFHMMLRIRKEPELTSFFMQKKKQEICAKDLPELISRHFSNFLNAYAKAYNERFDRRGSLFERPFKRKLIKSSKYFTGLIAAYIHNNPIHHGFVTDLNDWIHSSWHSYISEKNTKVSRQEGLIWFGGREAFTRFHKELECKDVMLDFE